MTAYLVMMTQRLVELHRVMKPTASLYLHCDPTASHYLKLVLDAVFGPRCFQNEIIWSYRRWPSPARRYQRMHDVILFYTKSSQGIHTFNVEYEPNSPSYQKRFKGKTQVLDPETKTRKVTIDAESKGLARRDVWEIPIIAGSSRERLGYPTQKPQKLLERIVATSSRPGDLVLDPFCGCGTAVAAAEKLERRWIGIDVTSLAIGVIEKRLDEQFEGADFGVFGLPEDTDDAADLARRDPFQFQWWAAGRVGAMPHDGRNKKGRDRGIDGIIPFYDDATGRAKRCIVSVKSGRNVGPDAVRDLLGTVVANDAAAGVLLTMGAPTAEMRRAAAVAGMYRSPLGRDYPKLQILTVADILSDRIPDLPEQEAQRRRQRRIAAQRAVQQPLPEWA